MDFITFGGASIEKGIVKTVIRATLEEATEKGGLTLFKFGSEQALKEEGWKTGDRFLQLKRLSSPKANWKQNAEFLRREMRAGNPIFDSYLKANGELIKTGGFLNAERNLLQSRGWSFVESMGAWVPPL